MGVSREGKPTSPRKGRFRRGTATTRDPTAQERETAAAGGGQEAPAPGLRARLWSFSLVLSPEKSTTFQNGELSKEKREAGKRPTNHCSERGQWQAGLEKCRSVRKGRELSKKGRVRRGCKGHAQNVETVDEGTLIDVMARSRLLIVWLAKAPACVL